MAVGEYIGDTLPQCPNRTSAFPASSRLVFGALVGALGEASADLAIRAEVLTGSGERAFS